MKLNDLSGRQFGALAVIERGEDYVIQTGMFLSSANSREETDALKQEYCRRNNLKLFEIRFDEDIPARVEDILKTIYN